MIVAHELFGMAPNIRAVADDLAAAGYLTLAPEFYHRNAPAGHWLAVDDAGREEGFRLLNALSRQQALDDVAACIAQIAAKSDAVTHTPAPMRAGRAGNGARSQRCPGEPA